MRIREYIEVSIPYVIVVVIMIVGFMMTSTLKRWNYHLFYKTPVKEYVDPKFKELERRISILESNATVRLH